ncbi:hypothetical protein C8J55DRAFT_493524 [Lentinula edodes]|uniref:NADH:flavin oxidoreductase/NADH oxidase N-terminal domain-containing protein n=1 Tax=Lentinula lateritia TaxID=40482 RepID=A0A9W9DEJ1_9AGAR|nr:hypothetical protein C8J55DRAFT_493524 [Lentinula edodes]
MFCTDLASRKSQPSIGDAPEQIASGQPVYAPSAIPARICFADRRGGKFRFLHGVPGYVTLLFTNKAAINAKEAGFDGIEVHGAGGYLIHQLLDSGLNICTDSWGGSFENRSQFGLEVLRVVIDVWGADRVGIKLDPTGGYNDMGMPLEETLETYNYFITQVDQLGLAYIAIQRYSEFNDPIIEGKRRAVQHDVVAAYSHLIKKSTFLSNGNFTPEEAAQYVSEGKISGVFWGQLWISHPDFAKRIRYGKPVDTPVDMQPVYGNTDGMTLNDQRVGYTDYPFAEYPNEA